MDAPGPLFIDVYDLPSTWKGDLQLVFLGWVYTYILMQGCELIGDGSELLETTSWKALIGPTILPVLGAVPDAAIVFFSGMGSDAQAQLSTGMGALAGSTVMLLTVPWILAIFGGRVDLRGSNRDTGTYPEGKKGVLRDPNFMSFARLFSTGVEVYQEPIRESGLWMFLTSFSYIVIEIPALRYLEADDELLSSKEKSWALYSAILCGVLFIVYLSYQYMVSLQMSHKKDRQADIKAGLMEAGRYGIKVLIKDVVSDTSKRRTYGTSRLKSPNPEIMRVVEPTFNRNSEVSENGERVLNRSELNVAFRDLGVKKTSEELQNMFAMFDADQSGAISLEEFAAGVEEYAEIFNESEVDEPIGTDPMKEALQKLSLGTFLVLAFSDPLVDVINAVGTRTGIPNFYLAFLFAPMVTNGSELIASYRFATKKTVESITCSLQQLYGAGTMNNTMTLGVFLVLVWWKDLYWDFNAEAICILFIQWIMVVMSFKKTHSCFSACMVLTLYPLCLLGTIVLEDIGLK